MPLRFGERQECHRITVDQLDLRELDGDDTAFLERGAKDLQVIPCDPPTDAQNDTLFNRKPVDSAGHARVAVAGRHGQTERQPQLTKRCRKTTGPADRGLVNLGNLVNVVNLVMRWVSAKLELRLVDVQRLDAMVERGWRHAEPRGGP